MRVLHSCGAEPVWLPPSCPHPSGAVAAAAAAAKLPSRLPIVVVAHAESRHSLTYDPTVGYIPTLDIALKLGACPDGRVV